MTNGPSNETPKLPTTGDAIKRQYDKLDRRGKLLADLRALSNGPGGTATIASIAADELEMAWRNDDAMRMQQAEENDMLVKGGPDHLLRARACIALINSAILLRQTSPLPKVDSGREEIARPAVAREVLEALRAVWRDWEIARDASGLEEYEIKDVAPETVGLVCKILLQLGFEGFPAVAPEEKP